MGGAGLVRCPQLGQATGSDQPRPYDLILIGIVRLTS